MVSPRVKIHGKGVGDCFARGRVVVGDEDEFELDLEIEDRVRSVVKLESEDRIDP